MTAKKKDNRPKKVVVLNGYEYTLVENYRSNYESCALGYKNFLIKAIRKLKRHNNEKSI